MDACPITTDVFSEIINKYTSKKTRIIMSFVCKYYHIKTDITRLYNYACKIARIPLIQWCIDIGCPITEGSCRHLQDSPIETIEWLKSHNLLPDWNLTECAINANRADILTYLCENGYKYDYKTLVYFANSPDIAIKYTDEITPELIREIVANNNYEYVEYIINAYGKEHFRIDMQINTLKMIKLIREHTILSKETLSKSAGVNLELYDWCIKNGANIINIIVISAIKHNQTDILKNYIEEFRKHTYASSMLANITPEITQFCIDYNILYHTGFIYDIIGKSGSIKLLQLYFNKYKVWNGCIYINAIKYKNYDLTDYCDKYYSYRDNINICTYALNHGSFELFLRYYNEGCIFNEQFDLGRFDAVKVINFIKSVETPIKISPNCIYGALYYNNINLIEYLFDKSAESFEIILRNINKFTYRFNTKTIKWFLNRGYYNNALYTKIISFNNLKLLKMIKCLEPETIQVFRRLDSVVIEYCKKLNWTLVFNLL
jgi:hypothetical protein